MQQTEKAFQVVREKGPVLPAQIASALSTSILFASAMLSELSSNGRVRISALKIGGGSPLYYVDGQEAKLQGYIGNLGSKQQSAVQKLRQEGVLRDTALEPVMRAALRETKDFARPLEVTSGGNREFFWKWYLLGKEEAEEKIRQALGAEKKETAMPLPSKQETQQQLQNGGEEDAAAATAKKKRRQKGGEDNFLERVLGYFSTNNIMAVEQNVVKKNAEAEFVIRVPTPVGSGRYYCRAKNKKRCTDADLSAAYTQGQLRKLPVLFLTTGGLTKKAEALLATDLNINFKTI